MAHGHQCRAGPLLLPGLDLLEELLESGRVAHRLPCGLRDELAHHRRPLACDVPQPVPPPAGVLHRHDPEVLPDRLDAGEPLRHVDVRHHRLGRARPDARDGPQERDTLVLDADGVEPLFHDLHLVVQYMEFRQE